MSERTQNNKTAEAKMAYIAVIVVAMLALPIALSFLKNDVSVVAFLIKATPFVLLACGIGGMIYVSKKDN